MSDFFLDFRPVECRSTELAERHLRFVPESTISRIDRDDFHLAVTRVDRLELWGPATSEDLSIVVALSGRIALESDDWEKAKVSRASGGLACRAILEMYREGGLPALQSLNGNFTVIIDDAPQRQCHIITDRCGASPIFRWRKSDQDFVFSSHPDLLASATGESDNLDRCSLGEFLSLGKLSFPHTYYSNIKSVGPGQILTIRRGSDSTLTESASRYFTLNFRPDHQATEDDLAESLGQAFRSAIRRRTVPIIGKTLISLSGGLDSRTVLCSTPESTEVQTICFFDEENAETEIARRIAKEKRVPFVPLHRRFEHYGDSAAAGIRISGGMASLASNHFLGFRERIQELGAGNLLTGCYCDYLFKGLTLNRSIHPFFRTESLTKFSYQWYRPLFPLIPALQQQVESRLDSIFPENLRRQGDELAVLEIEARRLFPFAYEPDHTQRLIPHRVMSWYTPMVDNDVIDVFLRTPVKRKMNAAMFSRMVELVCGPAVTSIPDSNTWAPVNASRARVLFELYRRALKNKMKSKIRPTIATTGSWPNWAFYLANSKTVKHLWDPGTSEARSLLSSLVGFDPFSKPMEFWLQGKTEWLIRLLTIKIWIDVRIGGSSHA